MSRKVLLLGILALFVFSTTVSAQNSSKNEDPASKLPFKKKLKWADGLYKAASYYTAEKYYLQLLQEQPRNPYINFRLAESFRYNRDYKSAALYYGKAYALASAIYPRAPYQEANMLKMSGQYDKALERYALFKSVYKAKDRRQVFKQVDRDMAGCQMAKKSMMNPDLAYVKNAGPNVNTSYTDYAPYPLGDTALLFATMNQNKIITKGKDKRENYISRFKWAPKEFDRTRVKDSFEVAMPFKDGKFNDKYYHIGNGAWSPGGDRFYYTKCKEEDSMETTCQIWVSSFERTRGVWGKSKALKELNFEEFSSTNPFPAMIGKKEVVFFSSNRKLQGAGGYDIWYSVYDSTRKTYRRPQNCGKRVNTPANEITPFYDTKKSQLYWASNGLVGLGGYDIFVADGGPSRYYNVTNMGFPINSPQDDMYYIQDKGDKANGYIVSNRLGSLWVKNPTCCDDIWRVIKEPSFYVRGTVINELTNEKIDQVVVKMTNECTKAIQDTFFSRSGSFMFYTPMGCDYSIAADKEGYVTGRTIINTSQRNVMSPDDTTDIYIYMTPGGPGYEFHVQNVYYDYDIGELRPNSKKALDSLVNFMRDNPSISVEIRSHTDDHGDNQYNEELSLERANAVMAYMSTQGIDRSRMIARGFGERQPIAPGEIGGVDNVEGRQMNRRTEFRIIGDVPGMRIIYDQNRPEYIDKNVINRKKRQADMAVPDSDEYQDTDVQEDEDNGTEQE